MGDRKRPKWSEEQWAFARGYLTPDIAAAERRRIRRAIAPALRELKRCHRDMLLEKDSDFVIKWLRDIDRATKAPSKDGGR